MAKHDVLFELPQRSLGRSDVKFFVKRNGKLHGTLHVSNGSVVWFPSGTKNRGLKVYWGKFEKMMQENATAFEKR